MTHRLLPSRKKCHAATPSFWHVIEFSHGSLFNFSHGRPTKPRVPPLRASTGIAVAIRGAVAPLERMHAAFLVVALAPSKVIWPGCPLLLPKCCKCNPDPRTLAAVGAVTSVDRFGDPDILKVPLPIFAILGAVLPSVHPVRQELSAVNSSDHPHLFCCL